MRKKKKKINPLAQNYRKDNKGYIYSPDLQHNLQKKKKKIIYNAKQENT